MKLAQAKPITLVLLIIFALGLEVTLGFSKLLPPVLPNSEGLWRVLAKVSWYSKYNAELKANIDYPKFSEEVLKLDGKKVRISGYLVPTEMYSGADYIILSAYPAAQCYFCGGAGPETVIEVYQKNPRFSFTQSKVAFEGRLELNKNDPYRLIYLLKDAKQVFLDK